jgi:3-deoxy-manno-octulosonate cytidylyltransferase (CMP-KDO synthetase)
MLEAAVKPAVEDSNIFCSNFIERIDAAKEFRNPNTIKVTMDCNWDALYFSREPIPSPHRVDLEKIRAFKQVCIIPLRRENLSKFLELAPTSLEEVESIDMLRILEYGYKV